MPGDLLEDWRITLKPTFKKTDGRDVDCIDLSQDRNKWRTLMDMVTKQQVLQNAWLSQELLVSPFQEVSYSCNLLYDALTAHLPTPLTRTTVDCPETKQEHFRRSFSDEIYKKNRILFCGKTMCQDSLPRCSQFTSYRGSQKREEGNLYASTIRQILIKEKYMRSGCRVLRC